MESESQTVKGFKFLHPSCCTYYEGRAYPYPIPKPEQVHRLPLRERWSDWMVHPQPGQPDGEACGPGAWHIMLKVNVRYGPLSWWPWWAEGKMVLGQDSEKARAVYIRLRCITRDTWRRSLRPPFNWGRQADLRWADLRGAKLQGANLREANLREADLREANLRWADLQGAKLRGANLQGANLREADLQGAKLQGAKLRWAKLRGANLQGANLQGANLQGAKLREADLRWADLRWADLQGAKLREAITDGAIGIKTGGAAEG